MLTQRVARAREVARAGAGTGKVEEENRATHRRRPIGGRVVRDEAERGREPIGGLLTATPHQVQDAHALLGVGRPWTALRRVQVRSFHVGTGEIAMRPGIQVHGVGDPRDTEAQRCHRRRPGERRERAGAR